ncbi:amidohydrolase family protein [Fodinibius halophilus]|uniref:Amidohydrolase family protein n=1 Tax=Fodinibius halophilus TaxID=1736908 RepID=A0A6M1T6W9_9BACT|nr:amidohydrolase family protein [Fodinibius halophilus]NGP89927.1 amidohydrolase family protein [Fodinibius halophilus]
MCINKYCLSFLLICFTNIAVAQTAPQQSLPIIDVHLHATNEGSKNINSDLPSVLQHMKDYNVVLSVLSGANRTLARQWKESAPDKFIIGPTFPCTDGTYPRMYPCFKENSGWPEISWLEKQYKAGQMDVMGELLYVYYGIKPSHDHLDPYFNLAAKYSIPVGVHAADGPPPKKRMSGCCPNFNGEMGNPLLLKPVLEKYPNLRIWLMHGGEVKFHKQAIELMKTHPNVYADMSILNSIYPDKIHKKLLKDFIEAGLGDRIMFGSDNVPIGSMIKGLNSFKFLSDEERRNIFYDNAATFFRLSKQTIATHHGK